MNQTTTSQTSPAELAKKILADAAEARKKLFASHPSTQVTK